MKKLILAALALLICLSSTACGYDKAQYRADVVGFCETVMEESQNLEYMHDYMWGYWTAAGNKDGTIDDVDSMVADAFENASASYEDWDIVNAMTEVTSKYSAMSETTVLGKDKEIESFVDKMYREYCSLYSLIVSPEGTRDIWESRVYESIDEIKKCDGEISKLME